MKDGESHAFMIFGFFMVVLSWKVKAMENRISLTPNVCHGKPVIRGTRVLAASILGALAGGDSVDDVLQDHPNITD